MSGDMLVINAQTQETRVALIEDGIIAEYYIERKRSRGIVGNIYKGRVARVLPGMQAAFVDIGLDKAAFLYVGDVVSPDSQQAVELFADDDPEDTHADDEHEHGHSDRGQRIEDLLREGQEILVQVVKDPISTKGPRVSTHITLPGRHLVLMPGGKHVGVSRRIENDRERRRLRQIVEEIRPPDCGFIVRTASADTQKDHLRADMEFLVNLWNDILRKRDKSHAPAILHSDLDLILRAARDIFSSDKQSLFIDDEHEYHRVLMFAKTFLPRRAHLIQHYTGDEPIFDAYGIEMEIARAMERKVWLRSGGYIIIDQAEALTAIDVNSGRNVGKRNLEETITSINLEAVHEIAYQLRLRNVGGLIIVDFIDMDKEANREKVYRALNEALKKDRARTNVLRISELGLVEMTRKRVRDSINRRLLDPCPYCEGRGSVKSKITVCYDIFRQIQREYARFSGDAIVIRAHPEVASSIWDEERPEMEALEKRYGKRIIVEHDGTFHREQFTLRGGSAAELDPSATPPTEDLEAAKPAAE